MHFGSTLRLLRVDAGLSLRELARRIGVSSAYLSRVENGHDPAPTPDRLIAIADALGLPGPLLLELARQAGPAVSGYLERVPEAGALLLEIARRNLGGVEIARLRAYLDEEFQVAERARDTSGRLVDLLEPSRIVLGVSCETLEDLVTVAAARLARDHAHPDEIVRRILQREHEAKAQLGGGVIAPHAHLADSKPAAVLLTLAKPLPIDTPDGEPVRLAIVLVGGDRATHLALLARIARLARYDLIDELCAARTPATARAVIARLETLW